VWIIVLLRGVCRDVEASSSQTVQLLRAAAITSASSTALPSGVAGRITVTRDRPDRVSPSQARFRSGCDIQMRRSQAERHRERDFNVTFTARTDRRPTQSEFHADRERICGVDRHDYVLASGGRWARIQPDADSDRWSWHLDSGAFLRGGSPCPLV